MEKIATAVVRNKKPFRRGVLAVYKDYGVTHANLIDWTKQTIYFEHPLVTHSRLFTKLLPYHADWYQTGLCAIGFGLHGGKMAKFARYWEHEYLLTATLGKQTVDHYGGSPLVGLHEHRHIDAEAVRTALATFVGETIQVNPPYSHNQAPWKCASEEGGQDDEHHDSEDVSDDIEREDQLPPLPASGPDEPPNQRIKTCYSIDLLAMDPVTGTLRLRVVCESPFSCRMLVRDLGLHLSTHAAIEQLHLQRMGPLTAHMALPKHELHLAQIEHALTLHTPLADEYLDKLEKLYPFAACGTKYII